MAAFARDCVFEPHFVGHIKKGPCPAVPAMSEELSQRMAVLVTEMIAERYSEITPEALCLISPS